MKNAIKVGLTLGLFSIIITLVSTNLFSPESFFSGKVILVSFIFNIILMIVLGRLWLYDEGRDSMTYGEALKELFVASLLGSIISIVFVTAIYQNDKEMIKAFDQYSIESQETGLRMGMSLAGASENRIESELEEHREKIRSGEIPKGEYPLKWSSMPMSFLMQIVMSLINSLIAAVFVKKKGA